MGEDPALVCVILTAQLRRTLSPRNVSNLNRITTWISTWVTFPRIKSEPKHVAPCSRPNDRADLLVAGVDV